MNKYKFPPMTAATATVVTNHQNGKGVLPSPTDSYIQSSVIEGSVEDVVMKAPTRAKQIDRSTNRFNAGTISDTVPPAGKSKQRRRTKSNSSTNNGSKTAQIIKKVKRVANVLTIFAASEKEKIGRKWRKKTISEHHTGRDDPDRTQG